VNVSGSGDPLLDDLYAAAGDDPLGQLPTAAGRTKRRSADERHQPAR
jgi:hypothetical protein